MPPRSSLFPERERGREREKEREREREVDVVPALVAEEEAHMHSEWQQGLWNALWMPDFRTSMLLIAVLLSGFLYVQALWFSPYACLSH